MKKFFEAPSIEIVRFDVEDITAASGIAAAVAEGVNTGNLKIRSTITQSNVEVGVEQIHSWDITEE